MKEKERENEVAEAQDVIISRKHERLRNSLRSVSHSYKKEANKEKHSLKLKIKSAVDRGIQTITENFKNFEMSLKNRKDKKDETPLFGDFVLPGSIYLFHPYIGNEDSYRKYEETKSKITTVGFRMMIHL